MPCNHRPVPRWGAFISLASSQCSFNRTFFRCHGAECLAWWLRSSCLFVDTTDDENSALDIAAHRGILFVFLQVVCFSGGPPTRPVNLPCTQRPCRISVAGESGAWLVGMWQCVPGSWEVCPLLWDTPGEVPFCWRVLLSLSGHRTH